MLIRWTKKSLHALFIICGVSATLFVYVNCSGSKSSVTPPKVNDSPTATVDITVDANNILGTINSNLFGVNLNWNLLAQGIIEYGDIIRDRSFRLQNSSEPLWTAFPSASGSVTLVTCSSPTQCGDPSPTGGNASNGYVQLSQSSGGYNCIDQLLLTNISSGVSYDLNFSSYGESGPPALVAFFTDGSRSPISPIDNYIAVVNNNWTRHSLTITPTQSAAVAIFRICQVTAGGFRLDEVRLSRAGSQPQVKASAVAKLQSLGIKSLRWPGGTAIDSFDWKKSIGTRINRAEITDDFGLLETPALGLHEFLNLCENLGITPLVQVNVLDSSASAAELVEYILGASNSPQGMIRAANGRTNPWNVVYFEIGNEPATAYQGSGAWENTGANYASLAKPIATSMKNKASSLGKTIQISGIVEATYTLADWLPLVPEGKMLYNWNTQVFANGTGLKTTVDFTHGHFYTYEQYNATEDARFRHIMSGGEVLKNTLANIKGKTGGLPLWITEFNVKLVEGGAIRTEFLKDYQSGLAAGEIYRTMMAEQVPGAHFFNFSQDTGFGMTMPDKNFAFRPIGHAFSLVSPMDGSSLLSTQLTGDDSIFIPIGVGNIPSGTLYPSIAVVAAKAAGNTYQVLIVNSSYTTDEEVGISFAGFSPSTAKVYRYEHIDLAANNETNANTVQVTTSNIGASNPTVVSVPARSMLRLDFK